MARSLPFPWAPWVLFVWCLWWTCYGCVRGHRGLCIGGWAIPFHRPVLLILTPPRRGLHGYGRAHVRDRDLKKRLKLELFFENMMLTHTYHVKTRH